VDVCLAALGLALTAPALLTLAMAVRTRLRIAGFLRPDAPRFTGRPFECWKFRTMTDARDAHGDLLPDGER